MIFWCSALVSDKFEVAFALHFLKVRRDDVLLQILGCSVLSDSTIKWGRCDQLTKAPYFEGVLKKSTQESDIGDQIRSGGSKN